jgi:hypothetical protein
MKRLNTVLFLAAVGLAVGVLTGWASNEYRYVVEQDPTTYIHKDRKTLPIALEQDFCFYAGVKYRHGEMIYQPKIDITQICVIDEENRWLTLPRTQHIAEWNGAIRKNAVPPVAQDACKD